MAEQKIQFNIGSAFSGEGFKQAQKSVSSMNNDVKKGIGAINQIAGALGGMDAAAAKAMGAMSGLLNSLVTLNATSLITQGAMLAISAYVEKMNRKMEEAKERVDALKASVDSAFKNALADSMAELRGDIQHIVGDFETITKQATAMTAALSGLKGSVATGGIINLEIEKLNASLDAHSDAERQASDAAYDLKIAEAKAAASEEMWKDKMNAVYGEMAANRERIARFDDALAKVEQKRAELEEAELQLRKAGSDKAKAVADELARLHDQEAKLLSERNAALENSKLLDVKEKTVRQDAANATAQMTLAINKAELQIKTVAEKAEESARAEKEKAEATAKEAELKRERNAKMEEEKAVQKEAADAQKAVNDAARDLEKAEREYARALENYEQNFAKNKMLENIFAPDNGMDRGMAVPVRVEGMIKGEIVAHDLENAINRGLITSVKEMDRFARQRAREVDKFERDKLRQLERERQRYNTLRERNRKTWSQADREFAAKFEKLKAAAEAQKKAIEDAKKRLQEEQRREKENHDNMKSIKEKMEKLGLK